MAMGVCLVAAVGWVAAAWVSGCHGNGCVSSGSSGGWADQEKNLRGGGVV